MHTPTCIGIDTEQRVILWWCPCGWTGKSDPVSGRAWGVDRDHPMICGPQMLDPEEWAALGVEPMPEGVELQMTWMTEEGR